MTSIRVVWSWSPNADGGANVLALGQRTIPVELALEIVRVWFDTPFAGGRHARRIVQIEQEPSAGRAPGLLATEP